MYEKGHLVMMCFEVRKFIRNQPFSHQEEREIRLFIAAKMASMATEVFKLFHHRNSINRLGPYPQSTSERLAFLLWSKLRNCHTLSWEEVPRRTPSRDLSVTLQLLMEYKTELARSPPPSPASAAGSLPRAP